MGQAPQLKETSMKLLDVLGSSLGLMDTLLLVRASVWAWPFGILAICINTVLYFDVKLYADVILHIVYLISSIYGWLYWLYGSRNKKRAPITHISLAMFKALLFIGIIGTFIGFEILKRYTPSTTPLWDSATAVLSLIAQWLVCRKIIENWLLWFFIDFLYVGLYYYKGLPFHTLENVFYLAIAVVGYILWRKKMGVESIYEVQKRSQHSLSFN